MSHPFPYRTRSLSSPAPMILGSPGKVGRCQVYSPDSLTTIGASFFGKAGVSTDAYEFEAM
jgi:hypothetical protein